MFCFYAYTHTYNALDGRSIARRWGRTCLEGWPPEIAPDPLSFRIELPIGVVIRSSALNNLPHSIIPHIGRILQGRGRVAFGILRRRVPTDSDIRGRSGKIIDFDIVANGRFEGLHLDVDAIPCVESG